jgi:hypothetical protein
MVQVFGNRIIGGIGAPGGGMADAYGAGVNTALAQRESKQGLRLREQEAAWKTEDRAEAKRLRAKAEADAAAARSRAAADKARRTAFIESLGGAPGGRFFTLGAPTPPAAGAGAGAGARAPYSMGTPITTPSATPTAGVRLPGTPTAAALPAGAYNIGGVPVSSIEFVQGTNPAAGMVVPGLEVVAAPKGAIGFMGASDSPAIAEYARNMAARPGDFAARATEDRVNARAALEQTIRDVLPGANPATVAQSLPQLEAYKLELQAARGEEAAARQEGRGGLVNFDELIAEERRVDAAIAAVRTLAQVENNPNTILSDRGITALEGPEAISPERRSALDALRATESFEPTQTVTIQGPNGPMTVPVTLDYGAAATAQRFAPGAPPLPPQTVSPLGEADLAFGPGMATPTMGGDTPMIFGERLGAAPTQTELFFSDLNMAPPGGLDLRALMEAQNSPIYDPDFSAIAEQQRAAYVYAAQEAATNGDIETYMAATAKIKEQETLILTQQMMLGADEAANFNSGQRLSEAASMIYGGQDVAVIPTGNGMVDIYLNGELAQQGASVAGFVDQMRTVIDDEYRASVAAGEAELGKLRTETDEAIRQQTTIDRNKATLEAGQKALDVAAAIEQDLGIKMNELEVKQVEAALVASGKLPGPPEEYSYQKIGEDVIAVLSGGRMVTQFRLVEQPGPGGTFNLTLVETVE